MDKIRIYNVIAEYDNYHVNKFFLVEQLSSQISHDAFNNLISSEILLFYEQYTVVVVVLR